MTRLATATRVLLWVAIVFKLALLVAYVFHMRWVMDEFGQGYWGRSVPIGLYSKVELVKTVLPYPLYYAEIVLGGSALNVFQLWRASTGLAALFTIAAAAVAAYRLHKDALATLFSVFVLLCFTNFLEHAFRVRNDSFAVMFAMLSLVATLRIEKPRWSTYAAGLFGGLAFLCTQKAVYQIAPLVIAQVMIGWQLGGMRHAFERALRYGAGGALAVLLYALAFGGWNAAGVIGSIFISPLMWSDHLLSAASFPGIEHFVTQTLNRNMVPYLLCGAGVVAALAKPAMLAPAQRPLAAATAIITALVFRHPQPWPYVFVMCMPFLALFAPVCIGFVSSRLQPFTYLALTLILSLSFLRNVAALGHDNTAQFRVARQVEAMLGPHDRYFDGVAMLPTREIAGTHPWWWWDAPVTDTLRAQLQQGNASNFATIVQQRPKVWILNYRFARLESWLDPYLGYGTVRVGDVILVSGRSIPPAQTVMFQNLWPGPYHLVGADGRRSTATAIVDGRPCATPCRIEVGEHHVASNASTPAYLMPADVRPTAPMPITAPVFELYADVYDF
jgi:hypothetical protein